MDGPQVVRPRAHLRRLRERMQRPRGEPHPLEVLPVPLVQAARSLVLERCHGGHPDEPFDAPRDLLRRPPAQGVVRRLERHRVGPHHPEVVGRQHVGRPHAVLQARQARHLRRVASRACRSRSVGIATSPSLRRSAMRPRPAEPVRLGRPPPDPPRFPSSAHPLGIAHLQRAHGGRRPTTRTVVSARSRRYAATAGQHHGQTNTGSPASGSATRQPAASGFAGVSPMRSAAGFMRSASGATARRRRIHPARAIRAPPSCSTGAACRSRAAAPPGRRAPAATA